MGRRIIWDAIDNDGHRILDWYCPDELVEQKNSSDMKIRFKNGSILKFVGSDNYDSLVGSNFQGVVFSEYALQDPNAYAFLRPIAVANGAWMLFLSTPRGHNHLYELYNIAQNNKEWFVIKMGVKETNHIPWSAILKEKAEGLISDDLIEQEYNCNFDLGIQGSYYAKYLDTMRLEGRIGPVAHESAYKVHTAWDLGVHDSCVIIFFQVCNNIVRIIDYYENSDKGLEHYINVLQQKGYSYGRHIAPHDIKVREFTAGGMTRLDKAAHLGLKFSVCPHVPLADGIEAVRSTFSKMWIDETHCAQLIKALENYRKAFDEKRKVYSNIPYHSWASHACFVGDTKISMDNGDLAIKDVQEGMLVKTPFGLRKVLKIHQRLTNTLVDIHVGNSHLMCTPEHDIFTHRGLVKSDALRHTDIMEPIGIVRRWIWQKIYGLCSKAGIEKGFKSIYGNLNMDSTSCLMVTFLRGIVVNKSTAHIFNVTIKSAIAVYAILYSLVIHTFLRKHIVKNVHMNQLKEPHWVYDLTIEEDHCYYANGYLVSNSDAMRYLCTGLHLTRQGTTPEQLDKLYREAVLGPQAQLPPVFRNDLPDY